MLPPNLGFGFLHGREKKNYMLYEVSNNQEHATGNARAMLCYMLYAMLYVMFNDMLRFVLLLLLMRPNAEARAAR